MMTLKTLAAAACISFASAATAVAAPVDFNFSFTDGTNTITGLIEGLDSDMLGQRASAITVDGFYGRYSFATSANSFNFFDVTDSEINVQTVFLSTGDGPTADGVGIGSLSFNGQISQFFLDEDLPLGAANVFAFSQTITFTTVANVPLPAGGVLLLTGLGGAVIFNRRKKRAA